MTASPTVACQTTPATAETGSSLRARPAPSRQAATPIAMASSRARVPVAGLVTTSTSRARGSGASGSPSCARTIAFQASMACPPANTDPGSCEIPASSSISTARATVSSTTSAGPPPASTSIASPTSSALPAVRPRGTSIWVSRAVVRTSWSAPSPTITSASSRARSRSFMNAPDPTFTSSTSASVPSAIFFDMIELAMSGIDSTVPVMSRSA